MSVSRREFLTLLGTSFAGVAAVAGLGQLGGSASSTAPAGQGASATTGGNWIVDQIGAVDKGAVPVALRNDLSGEKLRVDVCRKGSANAVASSRHFDLFLANAGQGNAPTPRHHVEAARALAAHLDRHVRAVPATLQTQDHRLASQLDLHRTNDDLLSA
jgi:hypothetical protein